MKLPFRQSISFGILLSLLLPGLGHAFWKEYLFGIFVLLVMLMGAALFFVSFLINLPTTAYIVMFGIPMVFYTFTFVDLSRTIRRKRAHLNLAARRSLIFLIAAVVSQVAVPASPFHFALRNTPSLHRMPDNHLSPALRKGDLIRSCYLAYTVDLFFLQRPLYHTLPERFDIVSFPDSDGHPRFGVVIGLPNEEVEVVGGAVIADGLPQMEPQDAGLILRGDCPLTSVGRYSILVSTVYFGKIDDVVEVPLARDIGKVDRLL
jgi:hypothetical protein